MIRLVIDVEEEGEVRGTAELVAMLLEPLGKAKVVKVIDGKKNR